MYATRAKSNPEAVPTGLPALLPGERTYQSILWRVTGTEVTLSVMSAFPKGGWLTLVGPGAGNWRNFSAFGTSLLGVDLNAAATDAWNGALKSMDDIAQQLSVSQLGSIDLQKVRDGESLIRSLGTAFQQAGSDVTAEMAPLKDSNAKLSGNAASTVLNHLTLIQGELQQCQDVLTNGAAPTLADALHGAGDALADFGQQMAETYWQSKNVLTGAVADGTAAIGKNISDYLQQSGLMGGANSVTANNAKDGLAIARKVLAGYSSEHAGGLPAGMASISGDLTAQPVWDAANAAISQRLKTEIHEMDSAAIPLLEKLTLAYEAATQRLKAGADLDPGAKVRLRLAEPFTKH